MEIVGFIIIALMRVIQANCNKRTSRAINGGARFFCYGAYYQSLSALFALITLCIAGFYGFDGLTWGLSIVSALLFAVNLFASLNAIKGSPLVLCNMFSTGGSIFIPCIVGIFLFDEPMGIFQWLGLCLFVVAVWFMASGDKKEEKKITLKTLGFLVLDMFANGCVMVVQKSFSAYLPNGNVSAFSFLTFACNAVILGACLLVLQAADRKKNVSDEKKPLMTKTLYICGALLALALFSINYLVTTLGKNIPSVVLFPVSSAITITITAVVGAVAFKEKITLKKAIGMLLGLSAIVIINVL